MRILVTRPIQDGEKIAARLAQMGHEALVAPLLAIKFLDGAPLDLTGVQGVLATSANGVRALAARTEKRDLPLFAVGPQTAAEAQQAGFLRVRSADGDSFALAKAVRGWADPGAGILLHAAGEEAGELGQRLSQDGFRVKRELLYRMEEADRLPAQVADALSRDLIAAALFFSPRSASVFARCAAADRHSTARVIAICISRNTVQALGALSFAETRIAQAPNQEAMLACL